MDKSRTANVKVCIRVRPTRPELGESADGWLVTDRSITERSNPDSTFVFDHVFGPPSSTWDLYSRVIKEEIVGQALQGINGTVFAYGQTGSGKSFTMLGDGTPRGIVPYIAQDLFTAIQQDSERDYLVIVSILEIYNEKVRDLLVPEGSEPAGEPHIRESTSRGVYVDNCTKMVVESVQRLMEVVNVHLQERRTTAATAMNEHSSRSHCIVRLDIESFPKPEQNPAAKPGQVFSYSSVQDRRRELKVDENGFILNPVEPSPRFVARLSHLNMVDLAGSERVGKAQTVGQRKVEGANINKSLLELSLVISKLTDPDPAARLHIPYRNSKLTRILQTALGGNSCTAVICTLSPADTHLEESRNTLQFAKRAKTIKQQVWVNEIGDEKGKVVALQAEVASMKRRLVDCTWRYCAAMLRLQRSRSSRDGEAHDMRAKLVATETENERLRQQMQALQASLKDNRSGPQANSSLVLELQRQVADLQEEKRRLRDDNEEQEQLLNELEKVHDEDQAKLQAMTTQLQAKDRRLQTLEKEVREMEQELEQAASAMEDKDRKLEAAALQLERQGRQLRVAEEQQAQRGRAGGGGAGFLEPTVSVRGLDLPPDESPRVRVKGLEPVGQDGGGVVATSRVAELEEQLRQRDAQRDLIIDTKLKKMQELVIRFHQANGILKQNLTQVCEENRQLKELAYKDGKKGKKAPVIPDPPPSGIRAPLRLP